MRVRFAICGATLLILSTALLPSDASAGGDGGGSGGGGVEMPSSSAQRFDAAKEYREGIAALQASDYKHALRSFKNVLSTAPRDANTNYLAALAAAGLADTKGALRFAEKAVKLDSEMIPAHVQVGTLRGKLGDVAGATNERDLLAAKLSACAGCSNATALKDGIAAVDAAIAAGPVALLDPRVGPAFQPRVGDTAYLAAVSLINEHRYEEAVQSLVQARRSFGMHPDILTYLGFANRKLGRYDTAEDYYRQALALAPRHRGALEYYGELKIERGDVAGARANLALLDRSCTFGCYQAEELRRWIELGHAPSG